VLVALSKTRVDLHDLPAQRQQAVSASQALRRLQSADDVAQKVGL